jgi:hypothetical protein
MRIRLKGINKSTKRLACGTLRTYWYAWRGGPQLVGEPGSAEFIASYNAAVASKKTTSSAVLLSVLQGYQASAEFGNLRERTQRDYREKLKAIEAKFADFPLSAMSDRRTRGIFMEWRDTVAQRSRRQADYAWSIFQAVLSWALDRGMVDKNPCARGGRLYRGTRVDKIWTADDEAMFLKYAPRNHSYDSLRTGSHWDVLSPQGLPLRAVDIWIWRRERWHHWHQSHHKLDCRDDYNPRRHQHDPYHDRERKHRRYRMQPPSADRCPDADGAAR